MKTIHKTFLALLLITSMSCKNTTSEKESQGTINPKNEELTNTTNYKESGNFEDERYNIEKSTDSIDENWNIDDPKRKQMLYSRFDMTQEQIQKYEVALEQWWKSDSDAPYEKLSANERIKKEDEILKNILDKGQYSRYKDWANENDNR